MTKENKIAFTVGIIVGVVVSVLISSISWLLVTW